VRESNEYTGDLGHIPGSSLMPLPQLRERLDKLDKDEPIVTVCRSGGRSAQAATLLAKAGFAKVANLRGGMLNWHAHGLPVEGR
ncbi:MAG: rhodanese-like domain-containing protein, partial [Gammaproteobacteria bacterium]|nr:rhodanese-like domain-containing protein [Gammaproteobacteria bacterium]